MICPSFIMSNQQVSADKNVHLIGVKVLNHRCHLNPIPHINIFTAIYKSVGNSKWQSRIFTSLLSLYRSPYTPVRAARHRIFRHSLWKSAIALSITSALELHKHPALWSATALIIRASCTNFKSISQCSHKKHTFHNLIYLSYHKRCAENCTVIYYICYFLLYQSPFDALTPAPAPHIRQYNALPNNLSP